MQLRQLAAIKARQHDRAARMARRRGDQPVDQTRGLDLVAPAERLDDALHVAATLAEILVSFDIFSRTCARATKLKKLSTRRAYEATIFLTQPLKADARPQEGRRVRRTLPARAGSVLRT